MLDRAPRGIVVCVAPQLIVSIQNTESASSIHVWQDKYLTGRIKIKLKIGPYRTKHRAQPIVVGCVKQIPI
jgi:hypothetical protein